MMSVNILFHVTHVIVQPLSYANSFGIGSTIDKCDFYMRSFDLVRHN